MNLNKVTIAGRLTRDPELRHTPKGTAVTELGIAVNCRVKNGDQWEEKCSFYDITLWGRTAELAGEYLTKGRPVYIEGRLHLENWTDKESGQKRSKLKVIGESMQFLGGRSDSEKPRERQQERPASAPPHTDLDDEDQIPF